MAKQPEDHCPDHGDMCAALVRIETKLDSLIDQGEKVWEKLDAQNGRIRTNEIELTRQAEENRGMKLTAGAIAGTISLFIGILTFILFIVLGK